MGKTTEISWTRSTFNPWIGCTKVSPGCDNCYASASDIRWHQGKHWGVGAPRRRTNAAYWRSAELWNEEAAAERATGKTKKPDDPWTMPGFWPVFCASQADVLDHEVDPAWQGDLWALIGRTPFLDWLLTTKRIGNAFKMMPRAWIENGLPANVWMISTVVTQAEYDRDAPKLRDVPARIRGLSSEPMLEAIRHQPNLNPHRHIHWNIMGGESTQMGKSRPCDVVWIRDGLGQCRELGIAPFVKQLGSKAQLGGNVIPLLPADNFKRSKIEAWPADLQVREWPRTTSSRS
jgi:protein gp37